jgi:hypothetical protein
VRSRVSLTPRVLFAGLLSTGRREFVFEAEGLHHGTDLGRERNNHDYMERDPVQPFFLKKPRCGVMAVGEERGGKTIVNCLPTPLLLPPGEEGKEEKKGDDETKVRGPHMIPSLPSHPTRQYIAPVPVLQIFPRNQRGRAFRRRIRSP